MIKVKKNQKIQNMNNKERLHLNKKVHDFGKKISQKQKCQTEQKSLEEMIQRELDLIN